jgi:hypothetical protein
VLSPVELRPGDLRTLSAKEKGELMEEFVTPGLLRERGYEVIEFEKSGPDKGIDHLAWDPANEQLVVVESKFTSRDAPSTESLSARDGQHVQMEHGWIVDAWNDESYDIDIGALPESVKDDIMEGTGADSLEDAITDRVERKSYDKKFVVSQPNRNGKSISRKSARNDGTGEQIYWDDVTNEIIIVKLGKAGDSSSLLSVLLMTGQATNTHEESHGDIPGSKKRTIRNQRTSSPNMRSTTVLA